MRLVCCIFADLDGHKNKAFNYANSVAWTPPLTLCILYAILNQKGGENMKKTFDGFPNWYKYLLLAMYILPFPAFVIYIVVVLLMDGLSTLFLAFLGTLIIGGIIFLPFSCMYYAVLTFIHTFLDGLVFQVYSKKKSAIIIIVSFVCSAFWGLSSACLIQYIEQERNEWIPLIFMIVGCIMTISFLMIRCDHFASTQTNDIES
jgi:hypothetical protein